MSKHTILAILITIDCVVLFVRGLIGQEKTYDWSDALGALIGLPMYLWLLLS